MTKERLRRYFELDRDYEDSGRLDPGGPPDGPRLLEYEALAREFDAWNTEQSEQDLLADQATWDRDTLARHLRVLLDIHREAAERLKETCAERNELRKERDEARNVARHLLYLVEHLPECYTSEIRQMRRDIAWLRVEVRPVMQYLPVEEPDGSTSQ